MTKRTSPPDTPTRRSRTVTPSKIAAAERSRDRLSDRVTDQLRALIMTCQLEPGAPLNEGELSRRLGCGRTPMREAVLRLAEEWLIVVHPWQAAAVAPIVVDDLRQIYEARISIEGAAVHLASARITSTQIEEGRQVLAQLAKCSADLPEEILRLDFAFHLLLGKASGNRYLFDTMRRMLGPAMRLTFMIHRQGVPARPMADEHRAILDALAAGDAEGAENELKNHLRQAKGRTLKRL